MRENDEFYADSGRPVEDSGGVSRGTALKVGGIGLVGAIAAFLPGRAGAAGRRGAVRAPCTVRSRCPRRRAARACRGALPAECICPSTPGRTKVGAIVPRFRPSRTILLSATSRVFIAAVVALAAGGWSACIGTVSPEARMWTLPSRCRHTVSVLVGRLRGQRLELVQREHCLHAHDERAGDPALGVDRVAGWRRGHVERLDHRPVLLDDDVRIPRMGGDESAVLLQVSLGDDQHLPLVAQLPEPRRQLEAVAAAGIEERDHEWRPEIVGEAVRLPLEVRQLEARGFGSDGQTPVHRRQLFGSASGGEPVHELVHLPVQLVESDERLSVLLDAPDQGCCESPGENPRDDERRDQPPTHGLLP